MKGPRRFARVVLFLMASLVSGSCGDDDGAGPSGPVEATLSLEGTVPEDAAVLLELGPGATAVRGVRGSADVHSAPVRDGHSVAVFGALAEGPILAVNLEEAGTMPPVTLREIAASDGSLRTSLAGYQVRWKVRR